MKKIFSFFILLTLAFQTCLAIEINDTDKNYWAIDEIERSIQNEYLYLDNDGNFHPEGIISRIDFLVALLKAASRRNEEITSGTSFKDISKNFPYLKDLIISEQINVAFGYPDKTFKPNISINHNETMSLLANITEYKDNEIDTTFFTDYNTIPMWAKKSYDKNIANGLYVNYPDETKFKPNAFLTRAEAAVLLDKLSNNLNAVKEAYRNYIQKIIKRPASVLLNEDFLNVANFAPNNKVYNYNDKKVIDVDNLIIAKAITPVISKETRIEKEYQFTLEEDLISQNGLFLLPKGTMFFSKTQNIKYSPWRSLNHKHRIVFDKFVLPTGETYNMAGVPYTINNNLILVNKFKTTNKLLKKYSKEKNIIKTSWQLAPLLKYNLKQDDKIYILLTSEMIIPKETPEEI